MPTSNLTRVLPEAVDLNSLPDVPLRFIIRQRQASNSPMTPPPSSSLDPFITPPNQIDSVRPLPPLPTPEAHQKKKKLFGKTSSQSTTPQTPELTPPSSKKKNWLSKLSRRRDSSGSGEDTSNPSIVKSARHSPPTSRPLTSAQQRAIEEDAINSNLRQLHRETYDRMFGSIPVSSSSSYPLNSKSNPRELPQTWAAFVNLYRLGAIDLSDPPSLPFQDPAARASGIFTRIKDKEDSGLFGGIAFPSTPQRTKFVALHRPKTMESSSSDEKFRSFQSPGSGPKIQRPSTADGDVGQSLSLPLFSPVFDRSPRRLLTSDSSPSASPLRTPTNALQLSGCGSDDEVELFRRSSGERKDHSSSSDREGGPEVWEVVTSDRESSDESEDDEPVSRKESIEPRIPSLSSGRPSMQSLNSSTLVVKKGMVAPRPLFEKERQAATLPYQPEKLSQASSQDKRSSSIMVESPLITRSLADEYLEKEADQAQVEGLESVAQKMVDQLTFKMQVPGARFVLIDDEELVIVARSSDGGLGSRTERLGSFEVSCENVCAVFGSCSQ